MKIFFIVLGFKMPIKPMVFHHPQNDEKKKVRSACFFSLFLGAQNATFFGQGGVGFAFFVGGFAFFFGGFAFFFGQGCVGFAFFYGRVDRHISGLSSSWVFTYAPKSEYWIGFPIEPCRLKFLGNHVAEMSWCHFRFWKLLYNRGRQCTRILGNHISYEPLSETTSGMQCNSCYRLPVSVYLNGKKEISSVFVHVFF